MSIDLKLVDMLMPGYKNQVGNRILGCRIRRVEGSTFGERSCLSGGGDGPGG